MLVYSSCSQNHTVGAVTAVLVPLGKWMRFFVLYIPDHLMHVNSPSTNTYAATDHPLVDAFVFPISYFSWVLRTKPEQFGAVNVRTTKSKSWLCQLLVLRCAFVEGLSPTCASSAPRWMVRRIRPSPCGVEKHFPSCHLEPFPLICWYYRAGATCGCATHSDRTINL